MKKGIFGVMCLIGAAMLLSLAVYAAGDSMATHPVAPVDSDAKVLLFANYSTGSYADLSDSGLTCEAFGSPRFENGVAVLEGDAAYAYSLTDAIYAQIPANFSLEFKVWIESEQTYPDDYVTLVSNTESAGFGVSYTDTGMVFMEVRVDGAYQSVHAALETGRWAHVLATYDGNAMRLYIDGELAASGPCTGPIQHTTGVSRKLVVGGDVNYDGGVNALSDVHVSYVRLYDKALSAESAANLVHQYDDWQTESEPTCHGAGKRIRTCAVCGDRVTENIPQLTHSFSTWVTTTAPTCHMPGERAQICSLCGDKRTEELPILEHTFGDWAVVSGSKLIPPIVKEKTCSVCAHVESEKDWSFVWIPIVAVVVLMGIAIGVVNYFRAFRKK